MSKGKKASKKSDWMTIKVPREAYERAVKLSEKAAGGGWQMFGVMDRSDRPTMGALVDEGLKILAIKGSLAR